MKKVRTLLDMEDNDEIKYFIDYLCIGLKYVEEQRNNFVIKHSDLVHELNACKEQLLALKQAKLDFLTMQHRLSKQIPSQKKRILRLDQLTEDPSSSGQTDLVLVKSSAEDTQVSIPTESQIKATDPSVAITDSLASEYDSADESSVCSTPLPLLEKKVGDEPVSVPKTIKSILKSKSTFQSETLKGVTINEPTLAPTKVNKDVSASKINSAPAGKLKM
ncbi:hypothetical protein Tco_1462785 [Tanacetum coccineum]